MDTHFTPRISEYDIVKAIQIMTSGDPSSVVEVRCLNTDKYGSTMLGYFEEKNFSKIPAAIAPLLNGAGQCYINLNQLNPSLLARSANTLTRAQKGTGTSDKDILRRKWLLIDADPIRPTGISATDVEKEAAWHVLQSTIGWMQSDMAFAPPVIADSGNGYHALYPIDLPNDEASTATVRACLRTLSQRFSNDMCKIDESVFNAARIVKLYGTIAKKGSHCPEIGRPHRSSKILEVPEAYEYGTKQ